MKKFKKPEFDLSSLKTGASLLGGATILYFGMKKIANALIDFKIQEGNAELHKRAEIASDLMRAHSMQTERKSQPQDSDDEADIDSAASTVYEFTEEYLELADLEQLGLGEIIDATQNQKYYPGNNEVRLFGTVFFERGGIREYDFMVAREDLECFPFFYQEMPTGLNRMEVEMLHPR